MGCGKSKHDVVTGNTTKVRKPSETESVKGKENEAIKRQERCRCQKTNEVPAAVSINRPEATVENNTNEPEEKEAGRDCGEKVVGETNDEQNLEEKKAITLPTVTPIVLENIVTEETVNVNESALPVDEQKAEKVDTETVAEEERSMEDKVDFGDVETEILPSKVEELKPDIKTAAESEVQEILTTENVETEAAKTVEVASTENDDIPVLKEEDKI